jgi:hypothetical protein
MRFNPRFTETITMFWRTGDSYVDGRFVPGVESSQEIVASVQRLQMRERQLLPEGFRSSETLKIYTEVASIQLIQNDVAAIIDSAEFEYKGKRYASLASERWDYLVPHYKITVVAKDG